jgi:twinkle protein
MEMRPMLTLSRMCRQEYGRSPTLDAIGQFHKWTDPVMWLYDQLGAVRQDKMLAVLRYCADKLKADHFVIDSLMKCGIGEDDYNAQKHFLDQLCTIGRDTGMHIHLVAHSRKQKDENTAPGKMDIKGTGTMTDQVDNVITVWRNKKQEESARAGMVGDEPDCLLICDKQRNGEWEGKIGLFFDPETSSYGEQKRRGSF